MRQAIPPVLDKLGHGPDRIIFDIMLVEKLRAGLIESPSQDALTQIRVLNSNVTHTSILLRYSGNGGV